MSTPSKTTRKVNLKGCYLFFLFLAILFVGLSLLWTTSSQRSITGMLVTKENGLIEVREIGSEAIHKLVVKDLLLWPEFDSQKTWDALTPGGIYTFRTTGPFWDKYGWHQSVRKVTLPGQ